jgi:hypothetical protein
MEDHKYYQVTYAITDACIDEEMEDNIQYIMNATGWDKEYVINSALQLGCKWHLKSQLNSIADYQLGEKSRKL